MDNIVSCEICNKNIEKIKYDKHVQKCRDKQESKIINLTETQQKALDYTKKKSKIYSKNTEINLAIRFNENSWDVELIPKIKEYFIKCKIIIHFKFDLLSKYFMSDTNYRNQFETKTSGGSKDLIQRQSWETNLFNKIYDNSPPSEKVKYGCYNLYNARQGVTSAIPYGDSYIILKDAIKKRACCVNEDSCNNQIHIADFDNFNHIILYLQKTTMNNLFDILNGKPVKDDQYKYIEVQIHGDITWKDDVEKLMINKRHLKEKIYLDKIGLPYEFI
ncbi:hypothetical protein BMW23_0703 [Bodo saltans virus]|uniref:Uncharacterized protein n=1 Tax=Bodo saltans virus TaxID=2024608 RepID=A0A2H4UV60_9VIRU|nr:hypothetical protein QJ851_gp0686 [Bodo saltans virus]ATZ80749.1 hypothetical protein BMW23_0703 [Bodo saltans virus]